MALRVRPGSLADAPAFTALANDHHEAFTGEPLWSLEEVEALFETATADPVIDDRYVERDGETVAGVHIRCSAPFDVGRLDLAVPLQDERGLVAGLLVDAALATLSGRPQITADAVAQATVPAEDDQLLAALHERGFALTGRLALLEVPVTAVGRPAPPPGITVLTFDAARHLDDGFAMLDQSFPTPGSNWYLVREDFEHMMQLDPTALPGLSLMAYRDGEPVGACINFVDTMRPGAGHVGMLAVARRERRSGIGRVLLLESFRRFAERGWTHARLTTIRPAEGAGGEAASALFASVGMTTVYDHDIVARPLRLAP